ncbi:MAG TPA: hypothetical protein DEE98_04510 [Elusimicrobia bacterium]|nr:hypothetical protein [Elusimicrobiota bacterium]
MQDSPALAWLPLTTRKKKNVIPLRGYHIFKTKSVCRLASSAPFVARPPVADTQWVQDSPALAWLQLPPAKKKNVIPLRGYHIFKKYCGGRI